MVPIHLHSSYEVFCYQLDTEGRLDKEEVPTLAQILLNASGFLFEDVTKGSDMLLALISKDYLQQLQEELESLHMGVLRELLASIIRCITASPHDMVLIEIHC